MRNAQVFLIDDAIQKRGSTTQVALKLMRQSKGIAADGCHPIQLPETIQGREFDLFLVDYRLSKEPDINHRRFPYTGISVGGLLRDRFPDRPIYLTSALIDEGSGQLDSEFFDRVIPHRLLTKKEGIAFLKSDALDFRKIRAVKHRTSIRSIHQLLKIPHLAEAEIERVLPEDLRRGLGARGDERANTSPTTLASNTIRFGRWIMHVLLVNPGVLYDSLFAATYMGMTEAYFLKGFCRKAEKHLYVGLFATTHPILWWKSGLTEMVVSHPNAKRHGTLRIWDLAPIVFKVPAQARPKCVVCGKPSPETVAYDREDPTRRGPAHLSCSEPDPSKNPVLYFEPPRVFVEDGH
jgi:hypothetical protein